MRLTARYAGDPVLRDVSVRVASGQFVAVVGANGAGKSTLLNSIMGLVRRTSGQVLLDEQDISRWRTDQRVRRGVTLVPEGRELFGDLSVKETLRLAGGVRVARARGRRSADEVLELFPALAKRARSRARMLSGGEQQMLAVARALMLTPDVILLDEPSIGLSPKVVQEVIRAVRGLVETQVGFLVVEQNVSSIRDAADYAYVLASGEVIAEGPGATILSEESLREAYFGSSENARRSKEADKATSGSGIE
jgi:branched-chain amino acid transport system ATP-binding protein